MATAVTLKKPDGTEIYPVTDISLVNDGIHAVDIEATTPVPAVETDMIADGAVTNDKIDWSTVTSTSISVSDFVTAATGYSIASSNIYKTGNLLVATITITKSSSDIGSGQVVVGSIKTGYRPRTAANYFAGLGDSEWSIKAACYLFVNASGDIYINNQTGVTGCRVVKALLTWFTK